MHTLEQLLGNDLRVVKAFDLKWLNRSGCKVESVEENYTLLKEIGFSNHKIAENVILLSLPESTLQRSYNFLRKSGISSRGLIAFPHLLTLNSKALQRRYRNFLHIGVNLDSEKGSQAIRKNPQLLYKRPETLKAKFKFLKEKGLKEEKIVANLQLLAQSLQTLKSRWQYLARVGLGDDKIATNAHLLSVTSETINRNYINLRRFFTKDEIVKFAPLLGINPETVNANVQLLAFFGIQPDRMPLLCFTNPSTKRKKVAWLLKNVLGPEYTGKRAREGIDKIRELIIRNPKILVYSISSLENKQRKLREKVSGGS